MNVLRARGRAGLGFSAGVFGNGFALTAATLERVPFTADSIAEDVEYHTQLAARGMRVRLGGGGLRARPAGRLPSGTGYPGRPLGGRPVQRGHPRHGPLAGGGSARKMARPGDAGRGLEPALSRGVLALLLTAALPVHWLHVFAMACAGDRAAYVLEAALLGAEPWRDLAALAAAPLYIVWKVAITPMVLRHARSRAEWARTKREAHQP